MILSTLAEIFNSGVHVQHVKLYANNYQCRNVVVV